MAFGTATSRPRGAYGELTRSTLLLVWLALIALGCGSEQGATPTQRPDASTIGQTDDDTGDGGRSDATLEPEVSVDAGTPRDATAGDGASLADGPADDDAEAGDRLGLDIWSCDVPLDGGAEDAGDGGAPTTRLCGPVLSKNVGPLQCGGCKDPAKPFCDLITHTCKTPVARCTDIQATCGTYRNECNTLLNCESPGCRNDERCDTLSRSCVPCQALTCEDFGYECGVKPYVCSGEPSGAANCGQCEHKPGTVCDPVSHTCKPKDLHCADAGSYPGGAAQYCSDKGIECGSVFDGCGGFVQCGDCPSGFECGASGVPNRCAKAAPFPECVAKNRTCGTIVSVCNNQVLTCGVCTGGDVCTEDENGGARCAPPCVPESNSTFCARLGAACGVKAGTDNCGAARSANCGSCTKPGELCGLDNKCGCTPETSAEFCSRNGKDCGPFTGTDNCGQPRVANCGDCTAPSTCGSSAPNVCGCISQDVSVTCAGKNCGTATDNCGTSVNCGTCSAPNTCGGGGASGVCGCTDNTTDATFCARLGRNCGTVNTTDACGRARALSCGTCASPETCGGSGTANLCGCTPDDVAACSGKNCGTTFNNCNQPVACGSCTPPNTCAGGSPGTPNVCGCTAETDAEFCATNGKNCGAVTAFDTCGTLRTVASCGSCSGNQTCGGGAPGTPNVCGCTPDNATACLGKTCGTAVNNCGDTISCGDCVFPATCGGGNPGVPSVCGCSPQSDAEFCSDYGKNCGTFTALDNCRRTRTAECGTCAGTGHEWNLASDFPVTGNPSGTWSLGSSAVPDGFLHFPTYVNSTTVEYWREVAAAPDGRPVPRVWKNLGASASMGVPGGAVAFEPSSNRYAIARWTAPLNGSFTFTIQFSDGDTGDTRAAVYRDGTEVWSRPSTATDPLFQQTFTLARGATVAAVVGNATSNAASTPVSFKVLQNGAVSCGGGGSPNVCGCFPDNAAACAGKTCGLTVNNCGQSVACGSCVSPSTCGGGNPGTGFVCGCTPEADADFCSRYNKNCGSFTATDNCGALRTANCGACTAPASCGGGNPGTANVCGCTDGAACNGRNCGTVTNACGQTVSCGFCIAPETCGGGNAGQPGVCGCSAESDAAFCSRLGKNCGSVSATDNCGRARTVDCGSCVAPSTCGGGSPPVANVCGCASGGAACAGKNCGTVTDACGLTVTCGTCTAPNSCGQGDPGVPNVCGCAAESDAALCARFNKNCGAFTATDNCGNTRTVASCGSCSGNQTCGGGEIPVANRCGCTPNNTAACAGKNCGSVVNNCGQTLSCGSCTSPNSCGGGGAGANVCGCTPETKAAFCSRLGKNCGFVTAPDNCGNSRTEDCGSCAAPSTCGGGSPSVANVCGCARDDSAACAGKNCGSVIGNCGQTVTCGFCAAPNSCGQGNPAVPNVCGCAAESDAALCARFNKNCGTFTATDNCGNSRTVVSCGICSGNQTCGGSEPGTANQCVCTPDNAAACAGKNCGSVVNNCGETISCGSCTSPNECGGGNPGANNVCGCTPETNTAFCSRLGKNCGSVTAADNCGASRTVDCGSCSSAGGAWDVAAELTGVTAASNPSRAFSFGYGTSATFFAPFTTYTGGTVPTWREPSIQVAGQPSVWRNLSGAPLSGVAHGELAGQPSASHWSIVRFAAPLAGDYRLVIRFRSGDVGETEARVVSNGAEIWSSSTTTGNPSFTQTLTLAKGATVDAAVGSLGDPAGDATPIVFTAEQVNIESCGGGGVANVCGCTPNHASACQGYNCGSTYNNCGQPVNCGTCAAPATCGGGRPGTAFVCGCTPETDEQFCSNRGKNCGTLSGQDNCGASRTVDCGSCAAPNSCGGAGVANVCGCTVDTLASCGARNCGTVTSNCNTTIGCGSCTLPETCGGDANQTPNVCGCTSESDAVFCADRNAACGSVSGNDNCNRPRTVASCGTCSGTGATCGGGGTPNQCGCTTETDVAFCARHGATCGNKTATDNCGATRTVFCGNCTGTGVTCGGGGTPNQCGCAAESDTSFCLRYAKNCGSFTATDNCGQTRTAACGTCPLNPQPAEVCGSVSLPGTTPNVCCKPRTCTFPSVLGSGTHSDLCGGTITCSG